MEQVKDMTIGGFDGNEGKPLIVPVEVMSIGENVNNGTGNVLVIPTFKLNGEDREDRESG